MAFALSMALFLFAWAALVADLAFAYTAATKANTAALIGSRNGANDLDGAALYNGQIKLNCATSSNCDAERVCQTTADNITGVPGSAKCKVSRDGAGNPTGGITAIMTLQVPLPIGVFGKTVTVGGSQTSCPEVGTNVRTNTYC